MTKQKEFYLIGIETRTDNKAEAMGKGEIPKMWERIFKENPKEKVKDRMGEEIYAVYSNYESDENGKYDYFIGYKVKNLNNVPSGLVGKIIQGGNYKQMHTSKGATYKVVPELWAKIWSMKTGELGGKRAFKTDFEIYGEKAKDPQNSIVEIFLGII